MGARAKDYVTNLGKSMNQADSEVCAVTNS